MVLLLVYFRRPYPGSTCFSDHEMLACKRKPIKHRLVVTLIDVTVEYYVSRKRESDVDRGHIPCTAWERWATR
jgi:hypothetical protein